MTLETSLKYGFIGALIILGFVFVFRFPAAENVVGSTIQGNEYIATSTGQTNQFGAITSGTVLLKSGSCSLGSVVVTGDNTGALNFYDATTSDATKRAITATTSLLLASVAASATEETYTFDVTCTRGLLMVLQNGTMPTTTVTYR